jgi:hypothetical protein
MGSHKVDMSSTIWVETSVKTYMSVKKKSPKITADSACNDIQLGCQAVGVKPSRSVQQPWCSTQCLLSIYRTIRPSDRQTDQFCSCIREVLLAAVYLNNLVTSWARVLLQPTVPQSRNGPHFIRPGCSSPCSQQPSNCQDHAVHVLSVYFFNINFNKVVLIFQQDVTI